MTVLINDTEWSRYEQFARNLLNWSEFGCAQHGFYALSVTESCTECDRREASLRRVIRVIDEQRAGYFHPEPCAIAVMDVDLDIRRMLHARQVRRDGRSRLDPLVLADLEPLIVAGEFDSLVACNLSRRDLMMLQIIYGADADHNTTTEGSRIQSIIRGAARQRRIHLNPRTIGVYPPHDES